MGAQGIISPFHTRVGSRCYSALSGGMEVGGVKPTHYSATSALVQNRRVKDALEATSSPKNAARSGSQAAHPQRAGTPQSLLTHTAAAPRVLPTSTKAALFDSSTRGREKCCFPFGLHAKPASSLRTMPEKQKLYRATTGAGTSLFLSKHTRTLASSPLLFCIQIFPLLHKNDFYYAVSQTFLGWHPRSIILIHKTKPSNYSSCIIHWPINKAGQATILSGMLWGARVGTSLRHRRWVRAGSHGRAWARWAGRCHPATWDCSSCQLLAPSLVAQSAGEAFKERFPLSRDPPQPHTLG